MFSIQHLEVHQNKPDTPRTPIHYDTFSMGWYSFFHRLVFHLQNGRKKFMSLRATTWPIDNDSVYYHGIIKQHMHRLTLSNKIITTGRINQMFPITTILSSQTIHFRECTHSQDQVKRLGLFFLNELRKKTYSSLQRPTSWQHPSAQISNNLSGISQHSSTITQNSIHPSSPIVLPKKEPFRVHIFQNVTENQLFTL